MRRGGILAIAALALVLSAMALGWSLTKGTGTGLPAVIAQLDGPQIDVASGSPQIQVELPPTRGSVQDEKTGTFVSDPDDKATLAQNPKDPKKDKDKKKEPEFEPRDYKPFLKDPSSMGFTPDEEYFRRVYWQINQNFVQKVDQDALFASLKKEVANLLQQAKVNPDGLKRLDKTKNVLTQLTDMYGGKVDKGVLTLAAIYGMLDGLKDPYTVLMTPKEYAKLQEQMQATDFGGIGIYIELDRDNKNQLTIFEPIEGTPAAKAGLEAGDQILKIEGKDTKGITLDMAQAQIRGPKGSDVHLTIRRKGAGVMNFTVTRDQIKVVSVSSHMMPNQIGYIRLRQFGAETSGELQNAIQAMMDKGAKALIVDLRNNGGGYIDAAVGVVGQFTKRGSLVVYTINRSGNRRDYNSTQSGEAQVPTVVLINEYSASASEITAGALRDHKVATLVGSHSFGKGSVQQLYPYPDGSAIKITIARFYSPSGKVIDHKGIEPDVALKMEPRYVGKEKNDTQLQKAVDILTKQMTQAEATP